MKPHFIPGIYNYCDRWCERCAYNHRCQIYAEEQKLSPEQKDPGNPAFWEYIQSNFRKAMEMVEAWAKQENIDWEAFREEALSEEEEQELSPGQQALDSLARDYARRTLDWLKAQRDAFREYREELMSRLQLGIGIGQEASRMNDAIEAIQWYSTMIPSKTSHALHAYRHQHEWYWDSPLQSDANGTAKVALLCIERSLGAWEALRQQLPEKADEIIDMLVILGKIRRGLLHYFPEADKFIRPGFDEPEA